MSCFAIFFEDYRKKDPVEEGLTCLHDDREDCEMEPVALLDFADAFVRPAWRQSPVTA